MDFGCRRPPLSPKLIVGLYRDLQKTLNRATRLCKQEIEFLKKGLYLSVTEDKFFFYFQNLKLNESLSLSVLIRNEINEILFELK